MLTILNLTQHFATPDQKKAGVVDLPEEDRAKLKELLIFTEPPFASEIEARAKEITKIAERHTCGGEHAMIGGAPYLMAPLEKELERASLMPVYAFSMRESVEEEVDGKVLKRTVFAHKGFVHAAHNPKTVNLTQKHVPSALPVRCDIDEKSIALLAQQHEVDTVVLDICNPLVTDGLIADLEREGLTVLTI